MEHKRLNDAADGSASVTVQNNLPGMQIWTAQQSGVWHFVVAGARGGRAGNGLPGGKGRIVKGLVRVKAGQKLAILVGQAGGDDCTSGSNYAGGGGGATACTAACTVVCRTAGRRATCRRTRASTGARAFARACACAFVRAQPCGAGGGAWRLWAWRVAGAPWGGLRGV